MSALKILRPDEIDISGTASFISGQNMSDSERNELEDFKISAKKNLEIKLMQIYRIKSLFLLQIQINYRLV